MSQSAEQIFHAAREKTDPRERAAYLEGACAQDQGLRAEVESLLKADAEAGAFLHSTERTAGDADSTLLEAPGTPRGRRDAVPSEAAGQVIGNYKLLQAIGEGGFGSVWMAQQDVPVTRKVALKIIKLGMDTRQVVARFEQERQALAILDHPNIAKVFDAGATETGRPYFVMELVKGDPIAAYADRNNLSIEDRLELFAQVCAAVQHAHTKGIIHRDIKPSNILVSTLDDRPCAKVIDFGIAKATASKLTEKTLFTEHRALIGTPEYMSPEQAEGSLDIDTRTDVYSLGVVLYELLTGSTPFSGRELRSAAYGEIQRIIREVDPPRPSTRLSQNTETIATVAATRRIEPRKLGRVVRGELDWIVMKALEKDRARRYETASGLALDVRRYLDGEAVIAAPPGAVYRAKKFLARHRGAVGAGVAVAAALLMGVVAFAWQAKVARAQRDLAIAAQAAEADQRAAAGLERDKALAAEAQTKKRAEELARVSEFQSKMLSQIDPTEAGERLMADLRERFGAALSESDVPGPERAGRAEVFAKELGRVNATDAAAEMIDRTILKPAVGAVETQFKDQPVVSAALRQTLAALYKTLGRFDDALALEREALATRRAVLGEEHPDTVVSLNNFGAILEAAGKRSEAAGYYRDALEKSRRVRGENDPETLSAMGNLGNLLRAQGKLTEAEPLLRGALESRRRAAGLEDRDTLISMNALGYLLIMQGKLDEAEPYWREAYETGKRVLGAADPDVVVWAHNMGGLLGSLGRDQEAEPVYRDALEATRRVRGEDHPDTLNCLGSLANNLEKQGRSAEAEALLRRFVEASTRRLGADHPDTLLGMKRLAVSLRSQGKLAEAEKFMRDSLVGYRRVLGNDHPSTVVTIGTLASLLVDTEKWGEAEALFREALEANRRAYGEDDSGTLVLLVNLGNMFVSQGRTDEGAPFIEQALAGRRRVSGDDDPETAIAISNLARVRADQRRLDEAEALRREALDLFRRTLGEGRTNTLLAEAGLGGVLIDQGKLSEAEPLCRDAAAGLERVLGKNHPRTGGAHLDLGLLLAKMERYAEAETELIEAERVLSTAQGVSVERLARYVGELVALYEAWDKAEPGKGHDAKAAEWKAKLEPLGDASRHGAPEGK